MVINKGLSPRWRKGAYRSVCTLALSREERSSMQTALTVFSSGNLSANRSSINSTRVPHLRA